MDQTIITSILVPFLTAVLGYLINEIRVLKIELNEARRRQDRLVVVVSDLLAVADDPHSSDKTKKVTALREEIKEILTKKNG